MSKNKGRAITKNTFIIGRHGGTKVCTTSFLLALGFTFMILVCMISWMVYYFGYIDYKKSSSKVVVLNAPETFRIYAEANPPEYNYIEYDECDAPYDFIAMSEILHKHAAGFIIYFPEDFDLKLLAGNYSNVLTYYRTDTLDYKSIRDDFVDNYLDAYRHRLCEVFEIPENDSAIEIVRDGIPTFEGDGSMSPFAMIMGRTFIPILLFIAVMYAAMASGTEAISGQKERGTFSRILLTPVSRKDIVQAFTVGVFRSAAIPAVVIVALTYLIPAYRHLESIIPILLLVLSLALFISAITVMISVMNDSVTSAQTAFLPVFFTFITIAVTCINTNNDTSAYYYYIPIYGQFYGIGDALNGGPDYISSILCSLITIGLAVAGIAVSAKLLMSERFTVSVGNFEDESVVKEPTVIDRILDKIGAMVEVVIFPLAVLSVFQLIAMIPVAIAYLRDPAYSDFIASLAEVSTMSDIINKTMEILGIFMNDPKFLVLMSISYILIICSCMRRVRGAANLGLKDKTLAKSYGKGIILGIVMMTLVFVLLIITGKATPTGVGFSNHKTLAFIFSMLMWFPQGAAEEVMFRGFMMPKLKKIFGRFGVPASVLISSLLFSVFHGFNGGFSAVALINIFLLAVLFALIFEKTGSIIITCAAHTMWNMFQGNIYGLSVSGNANVPSIINVHYTGSSFGPEGTWEATVVIVAALVLFAVLNLRRRQSSPTKS